MALPFMNKAKAEALDKMKGGKGKGKPVAKKGVAKKGPAKPDMGALRAFAPKGPAVY